MTKTAAPARILARYKVLLGGGPGREGGGALGRFESPLNLPPPHKPPDTKQGFLYGHLEPARRLINKTLDAHTLSALHLCSLVDVLAYIMYSAVHLNTSNIV